MNKHITITDIDHGWRRILSEIRTGGGFTEVGFFSDDAGYPGGVSVADVAQCNEYGTARIPERPFMRRAFDQNREGLDGKMQTLLDGVYVGTHNLDRAMAILGEFHRGHIVTSIRDLDSPPNAPSTIRRKGSSNPLIDTGQMMQSVSHREDK